MAGGVLDTVDTSRPSEIVSASDSADSQHKETEDIVVGRDIPQAKKVELIEHVKEKKLQETLLNKKLDLHKTKYYKLLKEE